ncbi:MAG: Fur family transcriptional regulator [Chloroflexota bacterium]
MSESRDQLREVLRESGRRLTSQRCLILDVLRESDEHLDAETVHDRARERAADISLATVYRTLTLLKETGLVEEHRLGEGHSHYEAVQEEPHYHFTCRGCGKVIEFDAPLVGKIRRKLCEREGVKVTRAHLHLSGYCKDCQEKRIV